MADNPTIFFAALLVSVCMCVGYFFLLGDSGLAGTNFLPKLFFPFEMKEKGYQLNKQKRVKRVIGPLKDATKNFPKATEQSYLNWLSNSEPAFKAFTKKAPWWMSDK